MYIKFFCVYYNILSNDEVFKLMLYEEFEILFDRIVDWVVIEGLYIVVFVCLKEVIELKKLNGGFMKLQVFDDFINDCYFKLFVEIVNILLG